MNPTPALYEDSDSDTATKLHLSPTNLKLLSGSQDLSGVTALEICVDTRENTLAIGAYLPNLKQLRMNNSMILSVRDLGSLSHLQALWMSHCHLQDLDGIQFLSSLQVLYVDYNSVSDLSPLSMLEKLQLLDLEGNGVDDMVQVQYLGLCGELRTLTLVGNPVCVRPHPTATQDGEYYNYRATVRSLVPQLRYLDDVRAEEEGAGCVRTMAEDWALIRDCMSDCKITEAATLGAGGVKATCGPERDHQVGVVSYGSLPSMSAAQSASSSMERPTPSLACVRPLSALVPLAGARPVSVHGPRAVTALGIRERSSFASRATAAAADTGASILTHGAGMSVLSGNPIQLLRARRREIPRTAPATSIWTPDCSLPVHVPEHTYDVEEAYAGERSDVFADLKAWREQHNRRLQAIMMEKQPQVLTIEHNEEEEDEDDEDLGMPNSEDSGEGDGQEVEEDGINTTSPDSFESLSPDLSTREARFPEVAELSLSPGITMAPFPPASAPNAYRRMSGIRTCRLKLQMDSGVALSTALCTEQTLKAAAGQPHSKPRLRMLPEVVRPKGPLGQLATDVSDQPMPSSVDGACRDLCVHSVRHYQPSKPVDRPAILRPHTAKAALQKHFQQHTVDANRGSSHLN